MKGKIGVILAAFIVAAAASCGSGSQYATEVEKWRGEYETKLKSDNGWLTVAGLFWLEEGINPVGSGSEFPIALTDNFKQGKFGEIDFRDGKAVLRVTEGVEATVDGKPVTTVELVSDEKGKPTVVQVGSQSFYLIKREDRYGIRLKDKESAARRNFSGLHWFRVDENYRVTASFEPFEKPEEIDIPNVLGGSFKMKSPGILKFELAGKQFTLQPVEEDEETLFIIFRDLSSRSETYEGGRFLYADKPVDGKVILDFNKAENPPCAYTPFATCPLPPPQNRLDVEIKAGEKRFDH